MKAMRILQIRIPLSFFIPKTKNHPLRYKTKKIKSNLKVTLHFFGRGRRTRTLKNGFGDRHVTITSYPYIQLTAWRHKSKLL